ncbi:MAG: zinc finger, CHC2-family protein [Candidatus Brocadiaceae bacterium]|nr:zinc finger, CHC2-family protein [Candidatus Brocadiaceae bacterium]
MDTKQILNRLDKSKFYQELIPSLKLNGKSETQGLCPFHDDHNPSLSVNVVTGLYHCPVCGEGGDVVTFYQKTKDVDFRTALKEIGEMAGVVDTSVKPKVVATFKYYDHEGKLLYTKERIEPGRNGKPKEFFFKHLENGKWTHGRGCDPVLYNLPGVMK